MHYLVFENSYLKFPFSFSVRDRLGYLSPQRSKFRQLNDDNNNKSLFNFSSSSFLPMRTSELSPIELDLSIDDSILALINHTPHDISLSGYTIKALIEQEEFIFRSNDILKANSTLSINIGRAKANSKLSNIVWSNVTQSILKEGETIILEDQTGQTIATCEIK